MKSNAAVKGIWTSTYISAFLFSAVTFNQSQSSDKYQQSFCSELMFPDLSNLASLPAVTNGAGFCTEGRTGKLLERRMVMMGRSIRTFHHRVELMKLRFFKTLLQP